MIEDGFFLRHIPPSIPVGWRLIFRPKLKRRPRLRHRCMLWPAGLPTRMESLRKTEWLWKHLLRHTRLNHGRMTWTSCFPGLLMQSEIGVLVLLQPQSLQTHCPALPRVQLHQFYPEQAQQGWLPFQPVCIQHSLLSYMSWTPVLRKYSYSFPSVHILLLRIHFEK